jgi:ribosomal protein S18 acetylase RimI-like enzyme
MIADVKRLGPGDGHFLLSVAEDVFDDELTAERVEHFLNEQNHILIVACLNGRVIGQLTAMVHRHLDTPDEVYIDNLGVTPQHQRHGVATKLIERMLEIGRELGCQNVWVATHLDNEVATALYRKTGAAGETVSMFSYGLAE